MDAGSQATLKNLCAIFGIPESATQPNPDIAYQLLIHLYGMPLLRVQPERHTYGNDILGATRDYFETYSPFVLRLGGVVIMMQEFPYYFTNLNLSTDKLVAKYKSIELQNSILKKLGFGGVSGAGAAGLAEAIKKGSVTEGAKKFATRAAGQGALQEAIVGRFGAIAPKVVGAVGVVFIIGGTVAYYSGEQQLAEMRAILMHRFQKGDMTQDQYRDVFGSQVDPSAIKKYWEYK